MQYVNLGRTGLQVSRLCLGCMTFGSKKWREWVLEEEESRPIIKKALDLGINFFDTANMYSLGVSEEITGRTLKEFAKRDEVVLATKVYFPMNDLPNQGGLSRKHIHSQIDASLKRLGTDYVDLYQVHRLDYNTPIEETLEALHDLVKMGKVRYIGASSMFAWEFAKCLYTADLHGWSRFVSMQNHYNLVYREEEREMLPLCREEGIGVIPWSPVARGLLAGNRRRGGSGDTIRAKTDEFAAKMYPFDDQDFTIIERVQEVADQKGVKPIQIGLSWVLHQPGITSPIVGTRKTEHLAEMAAAVEISLNDENLQYLAEPYKPRPISGHEYR
ncbi:aldo/keto reductase [bacterium]|nr:aldo/keto reductase [bacterium]